MCGSTAAQNSLSQSQTIFYNQMQQQDATTFAEDQQMLKQVQSAYSPILAAGPNQFGFSAGETNDLNTTATEGVAKDYSAASKALRENEAASGGDSYVSSGVNSQRDASLAESGADQLANEQLQIKNAGYQQGYNEFTQATSALEGAEGLNNSVSYADAATSAGSAAGTTDNQIAQENESWMTPLLGAAGNVLSSSKYVTG